MLFVEAVLIFWAAARFLGSPSPWARRWCGAGGWIAIPTAPARQSPVCTIVRVDIRNEPIADPRFTDQIARMCGICLDFLA